MSVKANVVANYLGQGWRALMGLAFVPLYLRYLGPEAYGLVGVYAVLQAWLSLLDLGAKPVLARETARFAGGAQGAQEIRDLLRTFEVASAAVAVIVALFIVAISSALAFRWFTLDALPPQTAADAIGVMGVVIGLRLIENVYVGVLIGLQRQVAENLLSGVFATVRGLGAVAVLVWVSPTIHAYFLWQAAISLVSVFAYALVAHRCAPKSDAAPRFSWDALTGVWRFALGMLGISASSLLLTQLDKVLLSRFLTMAEFGLYVFAAAVASALYTLVAPIATAMYPRFTQYVASGDDSSLRRVYHQAAQVVSVLMGAAAVVLIVLGDRVLLLWTSDPILTRQTASLLSVLAAGALLNGLVWIPYHMQLAHGWTSLVVGFNFICAAIMAPALFVVVREYGAVGAAWVWVALNAGYIVFMISLMHRRILRGEKARWYLQDVLRPLAASAGVAFLLKVALPDPATPLGDAVYLLCACVCVLAAGALASPFIRNEILRWPLRRAASA